MVIATGIIGFVLVYGWAIWKLKILMKQLDEEREELEELEEENG